MAETTAIQWCDATFNPWWGCERVSPACAHCYADTFARRLGLTTLWANGDEHGFRFFGDKHWDGPLKWARLAREGRLPNGTENLDGHRPRVFCASMADVFEDRDELWPHRDRLFALIEETPELDWLLLTKRPEEARNMLASLTAGRQSYEWDAPLPVEPLPNVWLGVSIENARHTWRADVLRQIPAAVRFISAEPLLGSLFPSRAVVEVNEPRFGATGPVLRTGTVLRAPLGLAGIDWAIIGGESGPKARAFHLEHARAIVTACKHVAACSICYDAPLSVPGCDCVSLGRRPALFVKQLGAKPVDQRREWRSSDDYMPTGPAFDIALKLRDGKGGDMDEWPADLRIREFPPS